MTMSPCAPEISEKLFTAIINGDSENIRSITSRLKNEQRFKRDFYSGGYSLLAGIQAVFTALTDLSNFRWPSFNQAGHHELTKEIFPQASDKPAGKILLGWAVAPDIEFFNDLRFHAQSDTVGSGSSDKSYFATLLRSHAEIMGNAYQEISKSSTSIASISHVSNFLRSTGYFLHLLQDLVAHRGVTFLGHAFPQNSSPDELSAVRKGVAIDLCKKSLEKVCGYNVFTIDEKLTTMNTEGCINPPNGDLTALVWLLPQIKEYLKRKESTKPDSIEGNETKFRWYKLPMEPSNGDSTILDKEIVNGVLNTNYSSQHSS